MLTDHGENAQSPERRDVRRPRRTYLDHAATSPLRPCAAQAMADTPALGNPSAVHGSGRAARAMLEDAREEIAALLGVRPLEIILTSGGTEADELRAGSVRRRPDVQLATATQIGARRRRRDGVAEGRGHGVARGHVEG